MKRVLFVTSEAVPFIKTGGLADVAGSLPKYFSKNEYEVSVMLPKYMCIREDMRKKMHHILHFYVDLGWRKQYVGILEAKEDGIQYYFIDNEFYFAGERPYNNIYEDVEKFAFFSKAVLEALPHMNYQPDIIHCHDWQTGLVPVYLENIYKKNVFYQNMKTVFTIHNLQFQGRWNLKAVKDITGLPDALFTPDKLESYGEGNYLKGGIVYADAVTTVSPTYAYEITTPDGGEGLDGLIRSNSYKLSGIINGIDYNEYNPKADPKIAYLYDANDLEEGKRKNKQALLKDMNLPYSDDVILSVGQGTVWGDLLKDEAVEFRGPAPIADPVTYQTTVDDIFVGGDMFTGPRFAIDAIAAGKEAAISIHRFVQPGSSLTIGRNPNYYKELDKTDILVENYDNTGRQTPGHNEAVDKKSFRDPKLVFTEEQVKAETARCLGCGASIVDPNKCVGCGLCTTRCEFDAIHLSRDLPAASTMRKAEDKLKYILPNGAKQAIKIKFSRKK